MTIASSSFFIFVLLSLLVMAAAAAAAEEDKAATSKYKISSVCFPAQLVTKQDFILYKTWLVKETAAPVESVSATTTTDTATTPEAKKEEVLRSKRSLRQKRYPSHLNPIFRGYKFLEKNECPTDDDGNRSYFCPTLTQDQRHRCISAEQICDGISDCPNGEDENPESCFYHRPIQAQIDELSHKLSALAGTLATPVYLLETHEEKNPEHGGGGGGGGHHHHHQQVRMRVEPIFSPQLQIIVDEQEQQESLLPKVDMAKIKEVQARLEEKEAAKVPSSSSTSSTTMGYGERTLADFTMRRAGRM